LDFDELFPISSAFVWLQKRIPSTDRELLMIVAVKHKHEGKIRELVRFHVSQTNQMQKVLELFEQIERSEI
jgi:hypothetical protein